MVFLCLTLWQTPYPLTEAVALLEDAARAEPSRLLVPDRAYYRPVYQLILAAAWNQAGSLDATLAWIKLLHVVPIALLALLLIAHLRPRSFLDAAAATFSVAVLVGSPGFRDNLEIPLSYTIVGMPIVLAIWIVMNRQPRAWHGPVVAALALLAIGFKEQGLVVVPVVLAAWWMRAPGATRGMAVTIGLLGLAYVALRLVGREGWAPFEQAIGFGFTELEPNEAEARFGAFPYWVYAYNGASTIANVLFAEPTRGVFQIARDAREGHADVWQFLHLLSSTGLTMIVAWWGIRSVRRAAEWSYEARLFIVLLVALLACGALSFNYSRDRLGGMATVFYALAAFFAIRAAAAAAMRVAPARFVASSLALALLAGAWQIRAAATVETANITAWRNQLEWLTMLPERRVEFAERPVYLDIMHRMIEQGTDPAAPRATRFPGWVRRTMGLP